MRTRNLKIIVGVALIALGSRYAEAQIRPAYQYPGAAPSAGPAGVQIGATPLYFTPYIGLGVGHDDNLFLSNANEKSSSILLFSPGFALDARSSNSVAQVKHQTQVGRYSKSDDDNYVDHTTRAQFDLAFDRRNFLRAGLDHLRSHDPRGSTDRPVAGRPDRYRLINPSVTYAFGSPGAQGRLEAYYSLGDKRYLNNRSTTFLSDRRTHEAGGAFYWRAMPRTYVLAEIRGTDIGYRSDASPLDAEERRYYIGISWEATAATTGTLKVGRLERDFDRAGLQDFDGTSWEALITWAPRTYSRFDFFSSRQTNEATGLGNFILTSASGVSWNHAWSSVLSTGVDVRFQKDDYQGFDRKDDLRILAARVGYKFRRWLTLGAEYTHTQRDSNRPIFEYDKNLYLLTATASM
jgi:polysaccharide biosynthesis protein VpsM